MSTDQTIADRHGKYGLFFANASATQLLKFALHKGLNWNRLEADQKEALEMIACKIGRILTGDAALIDSWHDIAGYAQLVESRLKTAKVARLPTARVPSRDEDLGGY